MRNCIVGLGNPGEKYKNNRHNVGFMFVDYILVINNSQLRTQDEKLFTNKKLKVISYKLQNFFLIKPQTFMNCSGGAVKKIVTSYKLRVMNNLIVVHDDLDVPLGKFKIQKGVGPKLHNGIESIEKSLGTKDFLRIRIGVDNRLVRRSLDEGGTKKAWIDGETYVLQDFTKEEKEIITNIFPIIYERLKQLTPL